MCALLQIHHIPDVDWQTTVVTFRDALTEVAAWSAANPTHTPLAIYVEFMTSLDSVAEVLTAQNLALIDTLLKPGAAPHSCGPPEPYSRSWT